MTIGIVYSTSYDPWTTICFYKTGKEPIEYNITPCFNLFTYLFYQGFTRYKTFVSFILLNYHWDPYFVGSRFDSFSLVSSVFDHVLVFYIFDNVLVPLPATPTLYQSLTYKDIEIDFRSRPLFTFS